MEVHLFHRDIPLQRFQLAETLHKAELIKYDNNRITLYSGAVARQCVHDSEQEIYTCRTCIYVYLGLSAII